MVEQDEFADEFMLIGGDPFAKNTEVGLSGPLRKGTKDLIVGSIFLDDVNNVFDEARFADPFGDGPRRLVGPSRESGLCDRAASNVLRGTL